MMKKDANTGIEINKKKKHKKKTKTNRSLLKKSYAFTQFFENLVFL